MTWTAVLLFIAFPIILAVFAWRHRFANSYWRWAIAIITLLIGILLTLYVEQRGSAMLTEFWGGVFGAFYVLTITWPRKNEPGSFSLALASIFLLGSIGMKEPFILVLFGAALLVTRNVKQFLRLFCIPLFIAAVAGILALSAIGILGPYISTYFPAMIYGRVESYAFEPFWMRGFAVGRILNNFMTYYAPAPLLGYIAGMLWICVPVFKHANVRKVTAILSTLHMWLLYEIMKALGVLLVIWNVMWRGMEINKPLYEKMLMFGIVELIPFTLLSILLYRRKMPFHLLSAFAAFYLTSIAVGIGGYVDNHFLFALPFYVALIVLFVRHMSGSNRQVWIAAIVSIMAISSAFRYEADADHLIYLQERTRFTPDRQSEVIARIDGLMDACGYERYFGIDTFEQFAFARHSTIGPLPVITFHEYLPINHQLVSETHANIRRDADIIIMRPDSMRNPYNKPIEQIIEENFTSEAPECAKPFLPVIDGFDTVFRNETGISGRT